MKNRLRDQPWALMPSVLEHLGCIENRLSVEKIASLEISKPQERDIVRYDAGGVRVVELSGVMMKRPDVFDRLFFGATDIDEVSAALVDAERDDAVSSVVLAIDSPGGEVVGTPELASQVREFGKPLAVFTDTVMASGAYWVGSQAASVYSTPSSQVGSVGVYLSVLDSSKAFEAMGLKVDLIKSGKFKAAGLPGTILTEEQREQLQDRVNAIHEEFKLTVKSRRIGANDGDMEGQVFSGREAASKRMVTGIVGGLSEVIERLIAKI